MVPILFAPSATSFTTNGLGRLADTISYKVIEELNGQYELELTYPKDGRLFSSIGYSSIIVAKPFQNGKLQPFRVYKISKPMKNLVTAYARHITYQLNFIPCSPFSGQTAKQVMQNIPTATAEYCPFTFTTTIDNTEQSVSPNLFGLETVESGIINAYLDATGRLIEEENALSVWIKCEKSKRYSLSKMAGQCFAAGSMTQIPSEGQLVANYVSHPTDRKFEYTTTSDAEYLVMFVYRQSLDGEAAYVGIYNSISIRAIGTYTWMLYEPKTVRSFLMENEDSIQNIYGGEYEWDNYNVILHNAGIDSAAGTIHPDGTTIRRCNVAIEITIFYSSPTLKVNSTTQSTSSTSNIVSGETGIDYFTVVTVLRYINRTTLFTSSVVNENIIGNSNVVYSHPSKSCTCNSCIVACEIVVSTESTGCIGFST